MRWPWPRRRASQPSQDAKAAVEQAQRARVDAEHLAAYADEVADRLSRTRQRNHFALAITRAIRGDAA